MLEGSRGHFCDQQWWLGTHLFSAGEEGALLVSVPLSELLCLHYTVLTRFTDCCKAF